MVQIETRGTAKHGERESMGAWPGVDVTAPEP